MSKNNKNLFKRLWKIIRRNYLLIISITSIFVIVPLILNWLISFGFFGLSISSKMNSETWLGFWGAYLGGALVFFTIWQNAKHHREDRQSQIAIQRQSVDENDLNELKKSITEAINSFSTNQWTYLINSSFETDASANMTILNNISTSIELAYVNLQLTADITTDYTPCFSCESCSKDYKNYIITLNQFARAHYDIYSKNIDLINEYISWLRQKKENDNRIDFIISSEKLITYLKIDIEKNKMEIEEQNEKLEQAKGTLLNPKDLLDKLVDIKKQYFELNDKINLELMPSAKNLIECKKIFIRSKLDKLIKKESKDCEKLKQYDDELKRKAEKTTNLENKETPTNE